MEKRRNRNRSEREQTMNKLAQVRYRYFSIPTLVKVARLQCARPVKLSSSKARCRGSLATAHITIKCIEYPLFVLRMVHGQYQATLVSSCIGVYQLSFLPARL